MKDVIEQLIEALQSSGLENSPEELADIIWYASKTADFTVSIKDTVDMVAPGKNKSQSKANENDEPEQFDDPALPSGVPEKPEKADSQGQPSEGADLYASGSGGSGASAIPFRPPGGKALPNALRLSRALRPLIKRIQSPTQFVIDEVATANQIAQSNIWLPVIKKAPMRWFDLTLVIESSPSMRLWEQTTKELKQLFEHLGAFRDIRVWRLETYSDESHFGLYTEGSTATHSYKELIEPALPRLIVIAADCLSRAWQNPEFIHCLDAWGKEHPVSILQMLPQRLWPQSGLKHARLTKVSTSGPGAANRSLFYRQASMGWQKKLFSGKHPVPVISLETDTLANWARFITGSGNCEPIPAFIFNATEIIPSSEIPYFNPEETLARFKSVASPMAFRLACYLAAVPLRLPIMRLVQRVQLPDSEQTHLAEFFLSGLIKRVSSFEVKDTDAIEYEFRDGIRERLLALTPVTFVLDVQETVSDFINDQFGTSIDFHALINLAGQGRQYRVQEEFASGLGNAFARVTNQVLNMVGIKSMLSSQVISADATPEMNSVTSEAFQKPAQPSRRQSSIAPKEKINITYRSELNGRIEEIELPNKILVIGEFAHGSEQRSLEEPEAVNINRENFNEVLASFDVSLEMSLDLVQDLNEDDYESIIVSLNFDHINSFSPDRIIRQVPFINEELERRNGLIFLQRIFRDYPELKDQLHSILGDEKAREALHSDLDIYFENSELPPKYGRGIVESLFKQVKINPHDVDGHALRDALRYLVKHIFGNSINDIAIAHDFGLNDLIARLDTKMGRQLDEILHNASFQKLESAWRGLKYLVDRTDFNENNKISILNISKVDLLREAKMHEDIQDTLLFRKVYLEEYGLFGGEPYSTIIANYEFDVSTPDIDLMRFVSSVGAMAHAPVIAAASPKFFGCDNFQELFTFSDIAEIFKGPKYFKWNQFRESEDSRYLGLTMPRFLLRLPYDSQQHPIKTFKYRELIEDNHDSYCWGNSAFAFATRLNESFANYRWCPNIVGPQSGGSLNDLPLHQYESMGQIETKIPSEVLISDRREFELAEAGFIPLTFRKGSDNAAFFSANSIQKPRLFGVSKEGKEAEINYKLGTQLPYLYVVNRLAHYIKVLHRENVGMTMERLDIQQQLNVWIRQYVVDQDGASAEVRARRPFRYASITVDDVEGEPGFYKFGMQVRPHFKYMGADFRLNLIGRLDK